jgi:hypothetical protein
MRGFEDLNWDPIESSNQHILKSTNEKRLAGANRQAFFENVKNHFTSKTGLLAGLR